MKTISLVRCVISIAAILGTLTMVYSQSQLEDPESISQLTANFDQRIPILMAKADVQGLAIAVIKHGKLVWSNAYGHASVELTRKATENTIFEAASLGKVVFALITLRLADKGVIDLDESIAVNFNYPLLDHDKRFFQLTPRLILQHASGLPNWGSYALAEIREMVQFKTNPGEKFGYSGEAYTALQHFVEARSGRSLEQLF